ncbi:hypothetical protein J2Y41_003746 [Arthrobacter sp. 1088]|uniref:hypothetical protein n=1 Tax=Arthrobacter sp. 1088 TaxID=2817768 RepID=UPI00285DCC62|nr:hypothetical protein [Arthrobacter sp. 1088]MDR6688165.1 hypothetical protein [Arthrobacter sp. 1088]
MTVKRDSEGAPFSDATCFRCEQAGPHWASRHGSGDVYACRRCFATFADAEWRQDDGGAQGLSLMSAGAPASGSAAGEVAAPEVLGVFETK